MSQSSDFLTIDDQNYIYELVGMGEVDVHNLLTDDIPLLNDPEDIKTEEIGNIEDKNDFYPTKPVLPQNILSTEKYNGPYNFQVEVDNCHNSSNSNGYLYSESLNKVYIKIDCPLQLGFKVCVLPHKQLYIRATPVYSQTNHAQECVYRCINHAYKDNDLDEHTKQHIIRCSNPNAQYLGDHTQNERLSVLIPLSKPQTGTDRVIEMFQFVCQNSCPAPGMNRRPILVILTLEDDSGVVGRQTLNVRVCCSPKRDMKKDLNEFNEMNSIKTSKKRKIEKPERRITSSTDVEELDTRDYKVEISIPGKHNVQYVLKHCRDLMAGEVLKHKNKPEEAIFKKYHDNFSHMLNETME